MRKAEGEEKRNDDKKENENTKEKGQSNYTLNYSKKIYSLATSACRTELRQLRGWIGDGIVQYRGNNT